MLNKQIIEFATSRDPDGTLIRHIGAAAAAPPPEGGRWQRGQKLSLLLAGYFGAGNVGSDMRSSEIVRQIRHLLGPDQVAFTALALTDRIPPDVLADVRCRLFDGYVPDVLADAVGSSHGVVACEGSMFKSTFSNVLSAVMAGALGMAVRGRKLAVGYGAEVAAMDHVLEDFVADHAGGALILCRNLASLRTAESLGLRASWGADTAWSFDAAPPEAAAALLSGLGWNGTDPLLVICPSNPFWWPVRANPAMALAMQKTGAHQALSYGAVFFHADSAEIQARYRTYIEQLAIAVRKLARDAFPVLVGMERVDETACRDLSAELGRDLPIVMGHAHRVGEVVAILRASRLLISSRFHAMVGAMPAAVPSIGIAMDERIRNLLADAGQGERLLRADDPDLGQATIEAAGRLDPDHVRTASRATVAGAIEGMGRMGVGFVEEVRRLLPDFPLPEHPKSWQGHLAPLPRLIEDLLN